MSNRQERLIKEATKRYRNPEAAIADGYLSSETCVELPGVGGMGYHYVKPPLIDSTVDPTQPEVLVYYRTKSGGKLRLGAVEYFVPDADQDPGTDSDRPYLFDHGFEGPMPGHEPGMPIHFDLHAWIYKDNPAGTLADWNPIVTCPA
ncbi:MAG: hypothetical protein ACKV2O_24775 [Acidimicrobiales bacterium]